MSDGSKRSMYIPSELRQQLAANDLEYGALGQGGWRNDPTYDMDRRRSRTTAPRAKQGFSQRDILEVFELAGPD